jgi:hypothetical protein
VSNRLFLAWCAANGVRPFPAAVSDVARFVTEFAHLPADLIHAELVALDQEHEALLYAPPGKARAVADAFNAAHPIEPPRSWPDKQKRRFFELPHDLQMFIAEREVDRDKAVRRAQNAAAAVTRKGRTNGEALSA